MKKLCSTTAPFDVNAFLENYDPEEWVATAYLFIGESPEDPESLKVVSPAFKTSEYARRFFRTLHEWSGSGDRSQGDLRLSFIIDEDRYYIFFYADPENKKFKEQAQLVQDNNKTEKYGKEHFPISFQMVICKGFDTGAMFSLGSFHDKCAPGDEFLLTPFLWNDGNPLPLPDGNELEIHMNNYKWKIPTELNQGDYEYYHWHKLISRRHCHETCAEQVVAAVVCRSHITVSTRTCVSGKRS